MYRSKPTRNQIRQGANVIIFGTLVSYFVSFLNMSTRPVRNIQNISEECSDGRNSKSEREQIEAKFTHFPQRILRASSAHKNRE